MKPSNRISKIQTYYFARKLAEIRQLNEQGKTIINIGIGSPDIDTPKTVIEELKETASLEGASQYQSYIGLPELRQAFANWYQQIYDVQLDPEKEILPLMGSKEGIMHIHMAFCNPGDSVLIPNPGYPSYAASAKILGLNIIYYNLNEYDNWLPKLDELSESDLKNCKLLWINYPNMPTGANAQKKDLQKLIDFAKKHEVLLVNDNPYSLILNDHPLSIHSCKSEYPDILELNSLSKSHNMAGWRVGLVSGSAENIQHILKVKSNFDSGMYKPIQLAAAKALNLENEWFETLNKEYKQRATIIYKILDLLGCTYKKNHTGLFIWAKVNSSYNNGEELSDKLLYEYGIFATPGIVFGSSGDQYIRFSLCVNQEQLNQALTRIKTEKYVLKTN